MVVQLGSQVVLARLLFPADFGLLAMISPIIGFILVFNDMGLGQAIVQRPVLVQEQVSALFWISLGLSCVLGGAVLLISPLLAWAYGEPNVVELMINLGILIPISALSVNPKHCCRVRCDSAKWPSSISPQPMPEWSLLSSARGITGALGFSWRVSSSIRLCAARSPGWRAAGIRLARNSFLRCGPTCDPAVIGANLATFVTTSGDNLIVGIATGRVALGLYDRSYRLAVEPLGQMLAPISRVALPLLSHLADQPVKSHSNPTPFRFQS